MVYFLCLYVSKIPPNLQKTPKIQKKRTKIAFFCQNVSVYGNFFVILQRILMKTINMAEQKTKFEVLYSEEADAFLNDQTEKVRAKILYNVYKASVSNDPKLFKKLENTDIWEFRTLFDNIQYRLLAFWDKRNGQRTLVIATHGFVKKSQKTPPQEIHHAQAIKDIYFSQQ